MFTGTETEGKANGKGVRGRRDSQGISAVPKKVAEPKLKELDHLNRKKVEAREAYNEAINAQAEKHGIKASALNKLIAARAGDDFEGKKAEVEQMAFVFGVVDAVSAPAESEDGPEAE